MAPKNPVGKLAETALSTLKDPKAAAGRVVDQAKGTVALGKIVADTAGSVVSRAGRKGKKVPSTPATPAPEARENPPSPGLRAVPDTQPAAPTGTGAKRAAEPAAKKTPAGSADSPKKQGDPVAPAKKTTAKAATAKKAPAKKAPAKKVTATPADVAEVVEAAVAEDPKKTAARPASKPARKSTTNQGPAKKAAAKTSSPGGKLPPRKAAPGATGTNPSTGKPSTTQAEEGPVVDPAAAKQVASETATLRKAAESDPS